jgi:hypothetical protein
VNLRFAPAAGMLVLALSSTLSSPALAETKTFTSTELNYSVALPATCKIEEGPGTLEAVCSPDLNADKSQAAVAASALLLELDAERVPPEAKAYEDTDFRHELPEAVCGEADSPKVKIADMVRTADGNRATWTATVTCPEIKFLGLAERIANVRYEIAPGFRHRLMARVPSADAAATKAARDAFLASFSTTTPKSQ